MKTTMQELIEQIDNQISLLDDNFVGGRNQLIIVKNNAISKLEKEKEQIAKAFDDGEDIFAEDGHMIHGLEYYNNTYNQNI